MRCICGPGGLLVLLSCLIAAATAQPPATPGAAAVEAKIGYLASELSVDKMQPESLAGWELCQKLGPSMLVFALPDGSLRDVKGASIALDRFRVLWHHQGDAAAVAEPIRRAAMAQAMKKCIGEGRGLFLSGAALTLVDRLGLESFGVRRFAGGKDAYQASLVPVVAKHPVFEGLSAPTFSGPPVIPITDAGCPASADFHGTGGPSRGMLLARAHASVENPLVEYELGRGRVIVMGWRLSHYSLKPNAYRGNLERLTGNIVEYLARPAKWQAVVVNYVPPASTAARPDVPAQQWRSLELAIRDLGDTYRERYPKGPAWLAELDALKREHDSAAAGVGKPEGLAKLRGVRDRFEKLRVEALCANPLLSIEGLLFLERGTGNLGLPANWESNAGLAHTGYDNRIVALSPVRPDGEVKVVYEPPGDRFVGDIDLHFEGNRLLFSMPGGNGRWQVHELTLADGRTRELPLIRQPDVDNYDACYLPDGRILFTSTAPFVGVPCVNGSAHVTNTYILQRDGSIRQLTVDQEHNWCPTVLNNGRILYLRWEYADLPHSNSRILFHMNPDGSSQAEYFGSNSYFVNSFFYARPIPGHPTKVVGIATGHHGNARSGRMLIVDPSRGRQEADGIVQEIPGHGKKVEPIIRDTLADDAWPQLLHPYPLSEKYFLVSCKPGPSALWGIYLADVFDNLLLLKESTGRAMLEPVPLKPTPAPPAVPDRIDPRRKDALVYMNDVYTGGGLKGIPRGAVKKLRLFTYRFSYRGMGGLLGAIGMDGPWDIKQVLGTVPVETDGSALFRVPAYTPIAVQPLDAEGKALQLMRSWFTAMPGETLSCVGCHEHQNTATPGRHTIAARGKPAEITSWRGPVRGFAFAREVQPVLDRYCVGCHNGAAAGQTAAAAPNPDLRGQRMISDWSSQIAGNVGTAVGGKFSVPYAELHRFVRRPGIEDDLHMLAPMEYHADCTELVQMLRKGHHGVRLDDEAWDRLVTWIDLNAPYHGTWTEIVGQQNVQPMAARAREMRRLYTGMDDPSEQIYAAAARTPEPMVPAALPAVVAAMPRAAGWPFDAAEAARRQRGSVKTAVSLDLGNGEALDLVRIPAGEFVMGDPGGLGDERPAATVKIARPFWIGRCEVTNQQYARFDPKHDSHVESMHGYQFGIHGYPADGPKQPVVRVGWNRAATFCGWLSEKTGRKVALPTEAQWEYACRAGTDTPFWFGALEADYTKCANLGDQKLREFALETYVQVHLIANPGKYDDWIPRDDRFNDGGFISVNVGRYGANPWGLSDMHGNVAEWTRSGYRPYPYRDDDGRNDPATGEQRVARGGSWYDRPKRCTSSFRVPYAPYQGVFNVGFRVVIQE